MEDIYCNLILYCSACAGNQLPEIFGMLSVDISVLRHISKQRGRQGGTTGGHRYRDTHYLADMQVMSDDVVQCLEETSTLLWNPVACICKSLMICADSASLEIYRWNKNPLL